MSSQKVSAIRYEGKEKQNQRWLQGHRYKEKITWSENNQKFYCGLSVGDKKARECGN